MREGCTLPDVLIHELDALSISDCFGLSDDLGMPLSLVSGV